MCEDEYTKPPRGHVTPGLVQGGKLQNLPPFCLCDTIKTVPVPSGGVGSGYVLSIAVIVPHGIARSSMGRVPVTTGSPTNFLFVLFQQSSVKWGCVQPAPLAWSHLTQRVLEFRAGNENSPPLLL